MESVVPFLIYTLPADLCAAVPIDNQGSSCLPTRQVVFLRDPNPDDFGRFSLYASRVRVFAHRSGTPTFDEYYVLPELWNKLIRFGPKPIFPRIYRLVHHVSEHQTLEERGDRRRPFYPADALLGPKLQVVHIGYYGGWPSDQHRPTEFVKAIARWAPPALEELHVVAEIGSVPSTLSYNDRETASLSCPEIGQLQNLGTFEASGVNIMPAALAGLASLPRLQKLLLRVQASAYDWDALPNPTQGSYFPALADLHLREIPCEWCVAFVKAVTSPSIRSFQLDYHYRGEVPSILLEALCAALADHPSCGTLKVVDINTAGYSCCAGEQVYQSKHIAPLLSLRALYSLAVKGNCQIIVDDAMLDAMSRAWPGITAIEFAWLEDEASLSTYRIRKPGDANYPKATLAGILPLVRRCPDLTSLYIALDFRVIPDLEGAQHPPVPLWGPAMPALRFLWVYGSVFPDPGPSAVAVVMFLSLVIPQIQFFPQLRGLVTLAGIDQLFEISLKIRRQERRWALQHGLRLRDPAQGEESGADAGIGAEPGVGT